ncbi:MAG: beta-N-acetylhexosaminidase [Bryobacteraceae bacterium]|nr:beta-N-acetylhexosaminidase [Bryobacteraceae bacterium]
MRFSVLLACLALPAGAQEVSELFLRGYSVIPAPQRVQLEPGEVVFGPDWRIDAPRDGIAVRSLIADAASFHMIALDRGAGAGKRVRLAVQPGTVSTGLDAEIDKQAYRLRIADREIEIAGNGDPGLFYGVQTLLQLLKRDSAGRLVLPRGTIEDWPRLQLRFLHWDTKHHQDRMETLKRYLDWTARFKANMIGFELEDKFEYPSHPAIGAPGAFTTAELQEIVDYGLERHIQVVPVVQAPAHMAYVLKHPEFARLRADGNNYQSAMCDPQTYDLIFSMYDDVIKATKGVDYFYVSTDEVYYAGIDCQKTYNDENRSLMWVDFTRRATDFMTKRGRRPLAWVEYPLLPEHAGMLPPALIDGVIGEEEYLEAENRLGMRQMAYVSMQGAEFLFPQSLPHAGARGFSAGHLQSAFESIRNGRHWRGKPIGVFGAAWDDSGLHNETFWLGWSAVAQWGWNPGAARPEQHVADFMKVYYGPGAAGLTEVYRSMQRQADEWQRTWDLVVSKAREPGYGNSYGKGIGTTRYDQTLDPPPLPAMPDLEIKAAFGDKYATYLAENRHRMLENDALVTSLYENILRVDRNRYNLEVYLALARFMGHHWALLDGLHGAERAMARAAESARNGKPEEAVGNLVGAHNRVGRMQKDGERIFGELTRVFEKSRLPKGLSAGGRKFVHVLDDTKDHWADRTPDLGYMMAPERSIGLEAWQKRLGEVIQAYAKRHNVPVKGLGEARLEE